MADVNKLGWTRNGAGRIWVEALDGARPDAEPDLDQLIEQSAQEIGAAAPEQPVASPAGQSAPALAPSAERPATTPAPAPQGILHYLPAIAVALLVVLAFFVVSGGEDTPAPAPPTPLPTLVPTAAAVVAPTSMPVQRAVVGYFDYQDPTTATALTPMNMDRVVGKAGDEWRLVRLGADGGSVWVRTVDVPADLPVDSPLTDLTPKADPPVAVAPPAAAPPVVEQPAAAPPIAAPPVAAAPPPAARVSGEVELSRAPATAEPPAPAAAAEAETASFRVGGCGLDGSSKCPRTLPRVRER